MKTALETQDAQFCPINLEFLSGSGKETFDIYYKTESFGTARFVKFASSDPAHQDKFRELLASGESQEEFFIREEDVVKYYGRATRSLRKMVADPQIPLKKKTEKIYEVSKEIMKEFFQRNASTKILRSSEEVISLMENCLSQTEANFYGIAQITNKDYYTYTHSVNVGLYCMTFGVKTKMGQEDVQQLGMGGMLHDVGKSKIPLKILNKNGRLTDGEFKVIQEHTSLGVEILNGMGCYGFKVIQMAKEHHEKFKGGGYPDGLAEEEISLFGRVCKLMDVYDALTTRRPYKKALGPFDALKIMNDNMQSEFDPRLMKDFIRLMGPDL